MKTKQRTKTSKKRHPAASRSKSQRKSMRRGHPSRMKKAAVFTPVLIEETIIESVGGEAPLEYGGERPDVDKREEELSDMEILDREEKQHLY